MGKHRSALFVAFMLIGAAAAEVPAEKAAEAAREEGTALRGATDSRRLAITRPLQLDFPVISRVDQGDYTRFWVPGTLNAIPVKVEVSAVDGDPDLYVDCGLRGGSSTFPTRTDHKWGSANYYGVDAVEISQADWQSQHCSSGEDILISVYGYRNSTFSVVAHKIGSGAETLFDGIDVAGTLHVGDSDYYQFDAAGQDFGLTVSSIAGDVDVFVTCAGGQLPSSGNYLWESQNFADSDDIVHVPASDAHYCSGGFSIAVYAYSGGEYYDDDGSWWDDDDTNRRRAQAADDSGSSAEYIIIATRGSTARHLLLNFPLVDFVAQGSYKYFEVMSQDVLQKGLKITVAVQEPALSTTMDADLYVSCSNDALPTTSDFRKRSRNTGDRPDYVVFEPEDAQFCPSEGSFIIGVHGYADSQFSVVASPYNQDLSWIDLPLGVNLGGRLTDGNPEYYLFHLSAGQRNLQIKTTCGPTSGEGITVAAIALHSHTDERTLPTVATSHWRDIASGGHTETLTIDMTDPVLSGAWGISLGVFTRTTGTTPEYFLEMTGNDGGSRTMLSEDAKTLLGEGAAEAHDAMVHDAFVAHANAAKRAKLSSAVTQAPALPKKE